MAEIFKGTQSISSIVIVINLIEVKYQEFANKFEKHISSAQIMTQTLESRVEFVDGLSIYHKFFYHVF